MIKNSYVTEEELAEILRVDTKRIRDLRSHHVNGKQQFINHIKPTSKCIFYRVEDVMNFLSNQNVCSFGICDVE
jgi:hypothetical protein